MVLRNGSEGVLKALWGLRSVGSCLKAVSEEPLTLRGLRSVSSCQKAVSEGHKTRCRRRCQALGRLPAALGHKTRCRSFPTQSRPRRQLRWHASANNPSEAVPHALEALQSKAKLKLLQGWHWQSSTPKVVPGALPRLELGRVGGY